MRQAASLLLSLLLPWGGLPLPAQEAPEGTPVFRTETRLVVLHATVVDRRGNLITDLNQSAFTVYEDDVKQEMRIFRREDVPISLGLIIDNSGSMRDKRARVEQAAMTLVKASNREDEVFIVNFNDEAYLDVPMTSDLKKMEEGLARIDSRGGTAMRDAISMSIDYLLEKGKRDKKVLLVVTDGNDNTSLISLEKLVQKAQQKEVMIYALGLLSEEDKREAKRAKRALKAITEATGGVAYYPEQVGDVEKIALEIAHDLRNQYILGYSPTRPDDGSFRRVRVEVKGKGNPVARTRTGYYATPAGRSSAGSS